jgi:hypothetical protein
MRNTRSREPRARSWPAYPTPCIDAVHRSDPERLILHCAEPRGEHGAALRVSVVLQRAGVAHQHRRHRSRTLFWLGDGEIDRVALLPYFNGAANRLRPASMAKKRGRAPVLTAWQAPGVTRSSAARVPCRCISRHAYAIRRSGGPYGRARQPPQSLARAVSSSHFAAEIVSQRLRRAG